MTEADLYNILMNYAEQLVSVNEFFIGGTIAMVVAIFIGGEGLNIYIRAALVVIYTAFSFTQFQVSLAIAERLGAIVESISLVTADQVEHLPVTVSLLNRTVMSEFNPTYYVMVAAWLGCATLMAYPKFLRATKK